MSRLINWFEIPATDFDRARQFYENVFAITLRVEDMPGMKLGIFPYAESATGGAIAQGDHLRPAAEGVVIYLDGGEDLAGPLARAAGKGGEVLMPKTLINPQIGHIALFRDSEGNVIGLHSLN